jgi:hypothetical protein
MDGEAAVPPQENGAATPFHKMLYFLHLFFL